MPSQIDLDKPSGFRLPAECARLKGFLVSLQQRVNRATGELVLTAKDLERIARYAFDYKRGGWQERLQRIFGRNLGPMLGRQQHAA